MLRERAHRATNNRSIFSSPPRKGSIEPVMDPNRDLEIVIDDDEILNSSANKKKKQR